MLYKKIDPESESTITSALDIFRTPPTSAAIANAAYREYLTLNPINSKPFHFKIHPISSYIDLSKCFLMTEFKIFKEDKDRNIVDIVDADIISTIQIPGATFIKNLDISINGQEIFNSNQLYSYKVYFDTELNYSKDVKDSFLSLSGYCYDDADQNVATGTGCRNRKKYFAGGKSAQFITNIGADLFNQDLYLINNCEIDVSIAPQPEEFMLIQDVANTTMYHLELINIKLYVKTIDLMDGLTLDLARQLDVKPARYGFRKSLLKSLFISEGRQEFNANIFTEEVPRRIIIGLLDSDAYNGNRYKSPFYFKNFDVRDISICANGRYYPQVPYNLDFENKNYARAYYDQQENLGFAFSQVSNAIPYNRFLNGWTIYVFNLTNSLENEEGFQLIKEGTTAINIKFNRPVPRNGITLIAYGEVDSLMLIDKNRALSSDVSL